MSVDPVQRQLRALTDPASRKDLHLETLLAKKRIREQMASEAPPVPPRWARRAAKRAGKKRGRGYTKTPGTRR